MKLKEIYIEELTKIKNHLEVLQNHYNLDLINAQAIEHEIEQSKIKIQYYKEQIAILTQNESK